MVRKLEDLVVSARDGVGSREDIIVDLLLRSLWASLLRPWKNSAAR